jgi:hypothetical protein
MPLKKYTQEQQQFIAENVKGTTTKELTRLFNEKFKIDITESAMKAYKTNHKLKSGTPKHKAAGKATDLYSEEVRNFIGDHYKGTGHKDMAELLNNTFGISFTKEQVKGYYGRFNLDSGLTGQFPKGNIPFNKGKKGIGGWEPTQFKKGQAPVNYRPVGSERTNVDGYVEIKVADPNKWRLKHQVIWESVNGPIPKGYAVIFGNSNTSNLDINNLILVTRGQLAVLNRKKLIQKDADLTRTAVIMADIYSKISKRKNKKQR